MNEFLSISNELADVFPDLVFGYDAQGNALLDLGDNANSLRIKRFLKNLVLFGKMLIIRTKKIILNRILLIILIFENG